jgi:hypothetical protein
VGEDCEHCGNDIFTPIPPGDSSSESDEVILEIIVPTDLDSDTASNSDSDSTVAQDLLQGMNENRGVASRTRSRTL